jgi:hypothetical protein
MPIRVPRGGAPTTPSKSSLMDAKRSSAGPSSPAQRFVLSKQRIVRDLRHIADYGKALEDAMSNETLAVESNARKRNGFGMIRLAAGSVILALSLYFIQHSLRFFSFDPALLGKYFRFKWVIMGHVAGGSLALLTGPFQLWAAFRKRYRRAHRVMGRVYVSATCVGALCALALATTTAPAVNWPYALSLHMLASVWLASGLLAFRTAVQKRFKQHEEWAIRSYIATVAFVAQALSFELPFVVRLGTFAEIAATLIWFSWTVPMLAYDYLRLLRQRVA